jgi:hypothetical protein
VPFSNEKKSSHSLDCAVNFWRNWFRDIVKSADKMIVCDHKRRATRQTVGPAAICPTGLSRRGDHQKRALTPFCVPYPFWQCLLA